MLRLDNTILYKMNHAIQLIYLNQWPTLLISLECLQMKTKEMIFHSISTTQRCEFLTDFVNLKVCTIFQWCTKNISITIHKYQILIVYGSSTAHRNLLNDGFCVTCGNLILTWCTRNQIEYMNYCNWNDFIRNWARKCEMSKFDTYNFRLHSLESPSNVIQAKVTSHSMSVVERLVLDTLVSNANDRNMWKLKPQCYPIPWNA